jgi:hypothetical protein
MATKQKSTVKLKPIVGRTNATVSISPKLKKVLPALDNLRAQMIKPKKLPMDEFNRLIRGDFTEDVSEQPSRFFRIFISSTFSDFKVERNELYRRVFPSVKMRCAQLGYEFQVVDMRYDDVPGMLSAQRCHANVGGACPTRRIRIIPLISYAWQKSSDA